MAILATVVFSGAAAAAIGTIIATVIPYQRQILDALAMRPPIDADDRWRRVHMEADRRRPFHQIRADTPRRGLLGRMGF
jgi:hypothetical protein